MISVMIREPPAEACAMYTVPFAWETIVGEMEESGRAPGLIKLAGEGG